MNNLDLLATTNDGFVYAKKLYEFLELDPTHYARWIERNLLNNQALEEGIDYSPVVDTVSPTGERTNTGFQPNPTTDYLITIEVAKELCMLARNEQGRKARKHFIKAENALMVSVQQYNQLVARVEQLGKFMEDKTLALEEKHTQLSEDVTHVRAAVEDIHEGKVKKSKWISDKKIELGKRIERLCHNHWRDGRPYTKEEMTEEIIRHMADEGIDFDRFVEEYKRRHNKIDEPYRLDVIFADGDLIFAFEAALDRIDMGLTPDANDDWDRMTEVFGTPEPDYDYDRSLSPIRRLSDGSVI